MSIARKYPVISMTSVSNLRELVLMSTVAYLKEHKLVDARYNVDKMSKLLEYNGEQAVEAFTQWYASTMIARHHPSLDFASAIVDATPDVLGPFLVRKPKLVPHVHQLSEVLDTVLTEDVEKELYEEHHMLFPLLSCIYKLTALGFVASESLSPDVCTAVLFTATHSLSNPTTGVSVH